MANPIAAWSNAAVAHVALPALGHCWLEILWHCLTKGVLYNETVHATNRNRALGHAA